MEVGVQPLVDQLGDLLHVVGRNVLEEPLLVALSSIYIIVSRVFHNNFSRIFKVHFADFCENL